MKGWMDGRKSARLKKRKYSGKKKRLFQLIFLHLDRVCVRSAMEKVSPRLIVALYFVVGVEKVFYDSIKS